MSSMNVNLEQKIIGKRMVKHTAKFKLSLFNQLAITLLLSIFSFSIIAVEAKAQQCTNTGPPVFGLTIITHGKQGENATALPAWVDEMAVAIAKRQGGIDKIPIYTIKITKDSKEVITASLQRNSGSNNFKTAGGAIIKVNWADLSSLTPITITTKIAYAIFTKLRTDLPGDWLKVPIHLIGHSRGASVNSRLAYDLGSYGIWVDHFTSLDPQPLTSIGDWVVKAYNNVLFADNYYRDEGILPWGEFIQGTYQINLNGVVTDDGYYCNQLPNSFAWAHTQIHTYYHGTIYYDTCADNISVQQNWYETPLPDQARTGYYFTRTGRGDRWATSSEQNRGPWPFYGLHYRLQESQVENRVPLSPSFPAWPNATLKPLSNYKYEVGSSITFNYYYQDADSSMDIEVYLDDDTNPFNNPVTEDNCHRKIEEVLNILSNNNIISATFRWTPDDIDVGSHYVLIKAKDIDQNVRYDYIVKPIHIMSVNQPESDLVIENFSVTPDNGEPGTPVTVNFTIHNIDSGPAYPSLTNIRLSSSNSNVSTSDTLLKSIETPRIEAGSTYNISESVTISDVDTSDTYYVWVILDVNNEANQSDPSDASDKDKKPFTVTVPPPPSSIGDYVQVYNTGTSGLRVRSPNACDSPLTGQNRFDLDTGKVIDGPQTCNLGGKDYQMWKIQWDDCQIGWSAQNWLKKISSATISCGTTPTITTSSTLPDGWDSYNYSWTLQAIGGTTPYSWSIVSGSLPPGLNLDSSTGTISETPTTSGTYDFRVRLTGNNGLSSEKDISLTINSISTGLPDLIPYAPTGWSSPLILRTVSGCSLDSCSPSRSFDDTDTIYVNWAVLNDSSVDTTNYFVGKVYVDGLEKSSWTVPEAPDPPLQSNSWYAWWDRSIGSFSPGQHTIKLSIDTSNSVSESKEGNNEYSSTFTVNSTTGSLQVTISPQGAIDAGAQWQVDNGLWRNSGETQSGLFEGSHTVFFKVVTGWSKPGNRIVTINASQPTIINETYTQQIWTGSLKVNISPQEAINAGAQWKLTTESTWHNSGFTQSDLSLGNHIVEFNAVVGWDKPINITANINPDQTTIKSGTYTQQTGTLSVTTTPVNGDIYVDGSLKGTGSWSGLVPVGSYIVSFGSVSGYTTPSPQNITVNTGQPANITETYTQTTVTISGYVLNSSGNGISGVTMTFNNGGGSPSTDSSGYYSQSVNYGWSGTVTPSSSGYTFDPSSKYYNDVVSNRINQNYTGIFPVVADTDNDGITDYEEDVFGTNPLKSDSDGDGLDDLNDTFPMDPSETKDSDAKEIRITNNVFIYNPVISGNRIVWVDFRNGNSDIYMYDISTGTETQITTDTSNQSAPDISGDHIVWHDYRNGNPDIYMYDISTDTETRITTSFFVQALPAISGGRIVWEDDRNGNWDIYMYDISTGTETRITTDTLNQSSLDISGDHIVWRDNRNGNWDIYMYDIPTGIETQITTDGSDQSGPAISGDHIVWEDERNGNFDIYMYDISMNTKIRITIDGSNQSAPTISGDRIVWQDDRKGNWDIYLYDISTSTEIQITTDTSNQLRSAISGGRIVWEDYRNGNFDIYIQEMV